jgi:hypothetical protein
LRSIGEAFKELWDSEGVELNHIVVGSRRAGPLLLTTMQCVFVGVEYVESQNSELPNSVQKAHVTSFVM